MLPSPDRKRVDRCVRDALRDPARNETQKERFPSQLADRIAYQRLISSSREDHNVVLVNVADGTESVIEPPETDGPNGRQVWYPFHVSWSPDGTTLLYSAWSDGGTESQGTIAVRADTPSDATVLADALPPIPDVYSQQWAPTQIWGRQPG